MATVRFSRSAKADLLSIGAYTLETWGTAQAERYLGGLAECTEMLAGNPLLGRLCDWVRPGLYRFEKGRRLSFIGKKRVASSFRGSCTEACCRIASRSRANSLTTEIPETGSGPLGYKGEWQLAPDIHL